MNDLIANIDKLHTTELGAERIKRNLSLTCADPVAWCKEKIIDPRATIERKGKNWYATVDGLRHNRERVQLLHYNGA